MWVLWSLHLMPGFWLLVVGSALPLLLSVSRVSVAHLLRPVEGAAEDSAPILAAVALERGLRAASSSWRPCCWPTYGTST